MAWGSWEAQADLKEATLAKWLKQIKAASVEVTTELRSPNIWIGFVTWPSGVVQRVVAARLADGTWARVAIKNRV